MLLRKPKVLHALPGRLRVNVPYLARWGQEDHQGLLPVLGRLLALPEGIDAVRPCAVTGNVLIRYDVDRLGEKDVLAYVQTLYKLSVAHRVALSQALARDRDGLERRMTDWLRQALARQLPLDPDMKIPHHVFE